MDVRFFSKISNENEHFRMFQLFLCICNRNSLTELIHLSLILQWSSTSCMDHRHLFTAIPTSEYHTSVTALHILMHQPVMGHFSSDPALAGSSISVLRHILECCIQNFSGYIAYYTCVYRSLMGHFSSHIGKCSTAITDYVIDFILYLVLII